MPWLILLVSGLSVLFKAKASMFKLFPYYLVFAIVGLTLFQSHESLLPLAFVVGLSVSSLLEISLIMYFGTLMCRGFFAPALAVTFSVASIRIGIALGNCLGLFYERHADIAQFAVTPTTLLFICILAFVLVPVGKAGAAASSRSPQHPLLLRRSIRSVPRSSQSSSSQSAKARS